MVVVVVVSEPPANTKLVIIFSFSFSFFFSFCSEAASKADIFKHTVQCVEQSFSSANSPEY